MEKTSPTDTPYMSGALSGSGTALHDSRTHPTPGPTQDGPELPRRLDDAVWGEARSSAHPGEVIVASFPKPTRRQTMPIPLRKGSIVPPDARQKEKPAKVVPALAEGSTGRRRSILVPAETEKTSKSTKIAQADAEGANPPLAASTVLGETHTKEKSTRLLQSNAEGSATKSDPSAPKKSFRRRRRKLRHQSSLEDLLRLTNAHAVHIALPSSPSSSIAGDGIDDSKDESMPIIEEEPKSSLDLLEEQTAQDHKPEQPLPESIPLPASRPESVIEKRIITPPPPPPPPPPPTQGLKGLHGITYDGLIDTASTILPHLKKTKGHIHAISRRDTINVTVFDTYESGKSSSISCNAKDDNEFWKSMKSFPITVRERLVIVEDLSDLAIERIGGVFGMNPEFFEEHLINSGYTGAKYNDAASSTWKTAGLKKSYASIKWYRPVTRIDAVPYNNQDLEDLLNPKEGRVEYVSRSGALRIYMAETNILRAEWPLWTDPKITTRDNRVCGVEERATAWCHTIPETGCKIVVLLLDPLPKIEEGRERDYLLEFISAPSEPSSYSGSFGSDDSPSYVDEDLEPIDDPEAAHQKRKKRVEERNTGKPNTIWEQLIGKITGSAKKESKGKQESKGPRYEAARLFKQKTSRTLIKQKGSRFPTPKFDFDRVFQSDAQIKVLKRYLSDTNSTTDDFRLWLDFWSDNKRSGHERLFLPLFKIIQLDSIGLLKILQQRLDELNVEILDETKMEERLTLWRNLITRAQLDIQELRHSMQSFFIFFGVLSPVYLEALEFRRPLMPTPHLQEDLHRAENVQMFFALFQQFDEMQRKLIAASSLLTSNMALLDSRRSIAEAHAVSKLTELAFFFIPLTFAASLFGMQIEQFENRAPLSTFIIIAIAFTAFSYLIRLAIRSVWLRRSLDAYHSSIERYADQSRHTVQHGQVPASLFLAWVWNRVTSYIGHVLLMTWTWIHTNIPRAISAFWHATSFVLIGLGMVAIIITAPLALLWTRSISHTPKTLVTIVILVLVVPMILIPYYRATDPDVRSTLPRLIIQSLKRLRKPGKYFMAFVWICVAATIIIPLAIIWTKPLARGIKVAVTLVIVLVVIVGLISYGILSLFKAAKTVYDSDLDDDETESTRSLVDD